MSTDLEETGECRQSLHETSGGIRRVTKESVTTASSTASISFGYDAAGRPSSVAFDRGTIGFTYHSTTGNLSSLSAPGGLGLAFTYDGSLPTSVTWSGAVSGSTAVTYNTDFSHVEVVTASGSALPGDLGNEWMDRFGDTL